MANTINDEVLGVRAMLGSPLPQAPSYQDILDELEAEYQQVTNQTNDTGNAWQVGNLTITTVPGQDEYQLSPLEGDFYKALNMTTVPVNEDADPQLKLEFTEIEHLPSQWEWVGQNSGQYMWSTHDSQLISFYKTIDGTDGAKNMVKFRPMPSHAQDYNVLYQVTDWWSMIVTTLGTDFVLPHSSQRMYIRALAAQNLLLKGNVMWSFDPQENSERIKLVNLGIKERLARYTKSFEEYRSSLDNPDLVQVSSWADENVW